jgi:hypothetical protein
VRRITGDWNARDVTKCVAVELHHLAPADFFLFDDCKQKLFGLEFDSANELLDWRSEFQSPHGDVLEKVVGSSIPRRRLTSDNG